MSDDVRVVREHDAAVARAGRDVSLRELNHALGCFGLVVRRDDGRDLQVVQTRGAVTPLRARVAELEAQVDALFRAILAGDESARFSRGVQMYAIPAARWDAIRRAAGIPFDSKRHGRKAGGE